MRSAVCLKNAIKNHHCIIGRVVVFPGSRSKTFFSASSPNLQSLDIFNPTEEHYQLRSMCREWAEKKVGPQALEFNRKEKFNIELFRECGKLGLPGVTIDPEFGGSGMDATAACIVHEEISAQDPAFCLSYLAHSLLFTHNLSMNGSNDQKRRWLPKCCTGELIGGMGMSEPGAGTDVKAMKTKAVRQDDGSFLLTGRKMWITNGTQGDELGLGDVFLIYANTGITPRDISLFIVEKGTEGFDIGQKIEDKCGMRASMTAELVLDNARVPAENLVGEVNGALLCMMRNLEVERLGLAAISIGIARRCTELMNSYANQRMAFNKPIISFGQIQRHVAESYADYMAGKSYGYLTAMNLDLNSAGNTLNVDGVKLYCSTMAKNVADRAIQVLGGYGYCGEYDVERLWRDAKLIEIGGGTIESHHKNIVRDLKKVDRL
eukprot:357026_1